MLTNVLYALSKVPVYSFPIVKISYASIVLKSKIVLDTWPN